MSFDPYGLADILAILKGCIIARPGLVGLPGMVCDATPEQIRIYEFIRRHYPGLRLSRPLPKGDGDSHHWGDKATDWIGPVVVPPNHYHPSVFQAFAALLKSDFPGGVGIGYLKADAHLHVDLRPGRRRWIEIDKPGQPDWFIGSKDPRFPLHFLTCGQEYGIDFPFDIPKDPGFYSLSAFGLSEIALAVGGLWFAFKYSDR